jgi:3-oxoacyl-[acyl-carrier protein] reductase
MRVEEVRAIITGAASGIGRHVALRLAGAGACVAAGDIDIEGLKQLKSEAQGLPGPVMTARLDVSQENSVTAFVAEASKQFEGINTLVNNACVLRDGLLVSGEAGWVKKLPTPQWKQVLDVNLTGPYLMTRETVADIMKRGVKPAVVVNISSISRAGNPGQSNYAASKAGLDACTRTWALELASFGIRVGGIAPGLIATPLLRHVSEQAQQELIAAIPLQRIGTTEEIWLALKFIIECDFFTGRVIEVDGGANF